MPIRKIIVFLLIFYCLLYSFPGAAQTGTVSSTLAKRILADKRLDSVSLKAKALISTGFTAGSGYGEIWIRDLNTFINGSLDVGSLAEVKEKLLLFFKFQGDDNSCCTIYKQRPAA